MYKINILIHNSLGELVDKQFAFNSLEEMGLKMGDKMFGLSQEAIDHAIENNMLEEELKSKEEHEFDKEDDTDAFRENLTEKSDLNNPANFI